MDHDKTGNADEDDGEEQHTLTLPTNLIRLGPGARRVTDADEETFLLYTLSSALPGRYGLGQVDSKHDLLAISFDLDSTLPPEVGSSSSSTSTGTATSSSASGAKRKAKSTGRSASRSSGSRGPSNSAHCSSSLADSTIVSALLHQDSTSLRSSAGDTGSVVWRSSLFLCVCLARQLHRRPREDQPPDLLNREALLHGVRPTVEFPVTSVAGKETHESSERLHVLELGAGTGVLPAILVPFLQSRQLIKEGLHWTATDLQQLMPLLRRNISDAVSTTPHRPFADGNGISLDARPLDWLHASSLAKSTSSYAGGSSALRHSVVPSTSGYPDLLIAVDCIFNPALFDPLLDTIDLFSLRDHTLVLLLVELRSAEAMKEFLESWLRRGDAWRIWSVGSEQMTGMERGYAAWVAWKESNPAIG